jgi:hypothetical protein
MLPTDHAPLYSAEQISLWDQDERGRYVIVVSQLPVGTARIDPRSAHASVLLITDDLPLALDQWTRSRTMLPSMRFEMFIRFRDEPEPLYRSIAYRESLATWPEP